MSTCIDLSVVIPVHNAGDFVRQAVASVLEQRCPVEFEVIVVDDHSTESATLLALKDVGKEDARVRVIKNSGRRGPGAARNVGIRAARGVWVAFLDADDVWSPNSLAIRWQALCDYPEASWVAGHYLVWGPNGSLSLPEVQKSRAYDAAVPRGQYLTFADAPKSLAESTMVACTCTIMVRKSLLEKAGGFCEDLSYGEDWFLYMNLGLETELLFVPCVVAHVRRGHESLTSRAAAFSPLSYKAWRRAYFSRRFKKYRRRIRWAIMAINRSHAEHHARVGNNVLAVKHALLALLWGPNDLNHAKLALEALITLIKREPASS